MPFKDPAKAKEYARKANLAWYHKNKEKILSDPKRIEKMKLAHKRRWSDPKYRAKINEKNKAYGNAHPEGSRKRSLAWRNRNLEEARAKHRAWSKSESGRTWYKARDHAYRAKKLAATINPQSIKEYIALVRSKKSVRCYYCQNYFSGKKIHFDHLIPLSKGGPHSIENLCVSCPHCNQTKINKPIQEWMRLGQQILAL